MKQYIDTAVVKAEIESKIKEWRLGSSAEAKYRLEVYKELSEWLNGIEVREVNEEPLSENLEEAANDYAHDLVHDDVFETFIAGAQWQKEQILGDDNKQYHRLRHETLKRLYENEAKLELMLDKALEGYIEKYEQIGGHNYLSLKIPMLSKPDNCKDGDKIKLIILKEK